ncbi:MAG: META domain-containing protein [Bacteroidales bacterium]|nr:META domain-containing protein [Bacteroidales bacterium]
MNKIFNIIVAALAITACNGGRKSCPKPVEDFIMNLYNNYVFDFGELDTISDNFAPAVLDSLRKAYDDEYCEGGPAYAIWLFRTGQNGSDEQSVDSIKVEGKDLYAVYLTDGGTPCTCNMHIVMKGGKPVLMDFSTSYEGQGAVSSRRLLSIGELEGEWRVIAVELEGVTYATVTMTFDTEGKAFGVYAGGNHIGGQMVRNERSADALRFENVGMTQMACSEEIEKLERKIATTLDKVRSFYGVGDDVFMADENDSAVLHLSRPETPAE